MVVKYYGYGELPNPSNKGVYRNVVINVLHVTAPERASMYLTKATPSACVWLVPGTIDCDGFHVG